MTWRPIASDARIAEAVANAGLDRRRAERLVEEIVVEAELVGMRIDIAVQPLRDLGGKHRRHLVDHRVGVAVRLRRRGIGEQLLRRRHFGRRVRQALAMHLRVVDALAAVGAAARDFQRRAHDGIGRADQLLHFGQLGRLHTCVCHMNDPSLDELTAER